MIHGFGSIILVVMWVALAIYGAFSVFFHIFGWSMSLSALVSAALFAISVFLLAGDDL